MSRIFATAAGAWADRAVDQRQRAGRGFRLDGYGVFFDVVVPSLARRSSGAFVRSTRTFWAFRARSRARAVKQSGTSNLEQALRRIELQVDPLLVADRRRPLQERRQSDPARAT